MPSDLEPFSYSQPGEFLTQRQLFQRVIGLQSSHWVSVLPADYDTPGGVYRFTEAPNAIAFAGTKQDEDCSCFLFQGIYIPMTIPLLPGSIGTDPELAPLVELVNGKTPEPEELQRLRAIYHRQLNVPVIEDQTTEEPEGESVPGESVAGVPPVVEEVKPVPPVIVAEPVQVEKPPEVAVADDDFEGLPPG